MSIYILIHADVGILNINRKPSSLPLNFIRVQIYGPKIKLLYKIAPEIERSADDGLFLLRVENIIDGNRYFFTTVYYFDVTF